MADVWMMPPCARNSTNCGDSALGPADLSRIAAFEGRAADCRIARKSSCCIDLEEIQIGS
jgi:hypothetical protein